MYVNVMTLVLCLFSSVRHLGVGVDTYQYYSDFTSIVNSSWGRIFNDLVDFFKGNSYVYDPGFTLVTKLFGSVINDFRIYCFFIALVFISAIGRIVYNSVEKFSGYVLCYGYYISLMYSNCPNNLMRQTLAMGILLWATIIIIEKGRYKYPILLTIIAISIHMSSILGVLAIGLLYVRKERLVYWGGAVLFPITLSLGSSLVSFLALNSGSERYMSYVNLTSTARPIFYFIEMLIFYLIGILSLNQIKKKSLYTRESYMCFAVGFALISLLWVDADMVRISYYFSVWGIPFVAHSVGAIKKKQFQNVVYLIALSLMLGRAALYKIPYDFYWDTMELHDRYLYVN